MWSIDPQLEHNGSTQLLFCDSCCRHPHHRYSITNHHENITLYLIIKPAGS